MRVRVILRAKTYDAILYPAANWVRFAFFHFNPSAPPNLAWFPHFPRPSWRLPEMASLLLAASRGNKSSVKELIVPFPALIFAVLALLFLVLAATDFGRRGSRSTPARKAWFRIGLIFAAVSIYLVFFESHL